MRRIAFNRKLLLIIAFVVIAVSSACTSGGGGNATPTSVVPTLIPATAPSTAAVTETASGELVVCRPYQCELPVFWKLGPNGPEVLSLSVTPGQSYDATAATGRLLYATKFPDHGAGPGNLSVGDLWWADVRTGETRPILQEEVVVKAFWAPNGQDFAYVRATPETYELRWHTAAGEDRLLAKDVAITFSVSPAGDQVAFTRESRYNVPGTPGFYVVDIASGQERQISDADRAGVGGLTDVPIWSMDGKHIVLPVSSQQFNALVIADTDGSRSAQLSLSPEAAAVIDTNLLVVSFWHPDGAHLVGSLLPGMGGRPGEVLLLSLNPGLDTIVSADVLAGEDSLAVSWDKPGASLWIRIPDNILKNVPVNQ